MVTIDTSLNLLLLLKLSDVGEYDTHTESEWTQCSESHIPSQALALISLIAWF